MCTELLNILRQIWIANMESSFLDGLQLTQPSNLSIVYLIIIDLKQVIDPSHPVVFVDTDSRQDCVEQIHSKKLVNIGEAALCKQVVSGLISAGLCGSNIGVICPYRHQLKIIREEILTLKNASDASSVEVETIDKYQVKKGNLVFEKRNQFLVWLSLFFS